MKKNIYFGGLFAVLLLVILATITPVLAQNEKGEFYIDKAEKESYTLKQAQMMKFRNENGKKLSKVKAIPAGYQATDDMSKMYVDEAEKEYYTPAEAKKMSYKNESGTALTQMTEIPEDFKPTDDTKKKN